MGKLTALNTGDRSNIGAKMIIMHPVDRVPLMDENDNPASITLLGKDSNIFVKHERDARSRNVENMTESAKWSAAEQENAVSESFAACTVTWSGIPQGWLDNTDDETPAVCNYENALKLYNNLGLRWVRDQVDKFIGTRANFLKPTAFA